MTDAYMAGYMDRLVKEAKLSPEEFDELEKYRGLTDFGKDFRYKTYKKRKRLLYQLAPLAAALASVAHPESDGTIDLSGKAVGKRALGGAGLGLLLAAAASGLQNWGDRSVLRRARKNEPESFWTLMNPGEGLSQLIGK